MCYCVFWFVCFIFTDLLLLFCFVFRWTYLHRLRAEATFGQGSYAYEKLLPSEWTWEWTREEKGNLFTTQLTEWFCVTMPCVCVCVHLPGSFWRVGCMTCGVVFWGMVLPHTWLQCVWMMLRDSVLVAPDAGPRLSCYSGGRSYKETGVVSETVERWSRTPQPSCWAVSGCLAVRAAPDRLRVTKMMEIYY